MSWDDGLIGPPFRIASSNDTPFRVMAGPGTGKTFAMKMRIARLLEQGAYPRRILAVTLTRTAASMLVSDLCDLNISGCESIEARTLHSFCSTILYKNNVLNFLGRRPRMLTMYLDRKVYKFECAPLIADLQRIRSFGAKKSISKLIRAYESAWATMQAHEPGWPQDETERSFNQALLDWLKFHEAMLVGELVPLALQFLTHHPYSSEFRKYDHIVVDEFQDLNKSEQCLLDLLASNAKYLVVGDANQSIYSFRFAHPEGIEEFHLGDGALVDEQLLECRRCGKSVVYAANKLIKNNYSGAIGDILVPKPDNNDGLVSIVHWPTRLSEMDGIVTYIKYLRNVRNENLKDVLVLSPRRKMATEIRNTLEMNGIPSHSYYQDELIDNKEIQRSITFLKLLENNNDRVSLRYWLGMNSVSYNSAQYDKLKNYCEMNNTRPFDVLNQVYTIGAIEGLDISSLYVLFCELKALLHECSESSITDLIDRFFPEGEEWATRIRALILEIVDEIESVSDLNKCLISITQSEVPDEDDYVRIMSFHKSKGLKSKYVVIVGCLEGLMPVYDNELEGVELEKHFQEQRRVFYVGVTRCVERLVVSYSNSVSYKDSQLFGIIRDRDGQTEPSRYVDEIKSDRTDLISGSVWISRSYGYTE